MHAFVSGAGSFIACVSMICLAGRRPCSFGKLKSMMLSGTGGTIGGVGGLLKSMNDAVVVALADPEGSGLYNKASSPLFFCTHSKLFHCLG